MVGKQVQLILRVDFHLLSNTEQIILLNDVTLNHLSINVGDVVSVMPVKQSLPTQPTQPIVQVANSNTVFGSMIRRGLNGSKDVFATHSVLLHGASGNGKTFLIHNTCEELQTSCIVVQPWRIFALYPGEAERACTMFLAQAIEQQPCVCMYITLTTDVTISSGIRSTGVHLSQYR